MKNPESLRDYKIATCSNPPATYPAHLIPNQPLVCSLHSSDTEFILLLIESHSSLKASAFAISAAQRLISQRHSHHHRIQTSTPLSPKAFQAVATVGNSQALLSGL